MFLYVFSLILSISKTNIYNLTKVITVSDLSFNQKKSFSCKSPSLSWYLCVVDALVFFNCYALLLCILWFSEKLFMIKCENVSAIKNELFISYVLCYINIIRIQQKKKNDMSSTETLVFVFHFKEILYHQTTFIACSEWHHSVS